MKMEKDGNSSVTKTKRGRPKKYATDEERKAALAAQRSRYYQDHKPEYNERAKKHYYKYREEILAKQKTLKARMQKTRVTSGENKSNMNYNQTIPRFLNGNGQIIKSYTPENKEVWIKRVSQCNFKLQMYAYVMYEKLQQLTINAIMELAKTGIYQDKLPKKKNREKGQKYNPKYNKDVSLYMVQAKDAIDALCAAVRTDERTYVLKNGLAPFPLYKDEFDNEGSVFSFLSQTIAEKETNELMTQLNYAIRRAVMNYNCVAPENYDAVTALMMLTTYEYTYRRMRSLTLDSIKDVPLKQEAWSQLSPLYVKFNNMCNKALFTLVNKHEAIHEEHLKNIQYGVAGIANHLTRDRTYEGYFEALKETFRQYAHYCIVKMIVKVRSGKKLMEEEDGYYLINKMHMTEDEILQMEKEFMKTRININGDIYDVKDYVPLMKNAPVTNKFINDFIEME